jgi:hypothetical protein
MTVDFSSLTDDQLDEFIGVVPEPQGPQVQDLKSMTDEQLDSFIDTEGVGIPKKLLKGAKKGLESLEDFASQVSFGAMDTLDQLGELLGVDVAKTEGQLLDTGPKNTAEMAGRIIGEFGTPIGPEGKLIGLGVDVLKSPKAAANLTRLKTAFEPIARQAKKSTATVIETISSVPAEFVKRALDNPQILEGKFIPERFRQLGGKAKLALKTISKREGKAVIDEQNALRSLGDKKRVEVLDHIDSLQAAKANAIGSERVGSALTDVDIKKIDGVVDKLMDIATDPKTSEATPFELHTIKRQIDNLVSFDDIKVSKPAAAILKNERSIINQKLRDLSPRYKLANADFETIANIRSNVLPKLREANLGVNIKTIMRKPDDFLRKNLRELDSTLPLEDRFYDELADLTAREPFEQLFPGIGGGSGSGQGIANLLRTVIIGKTGVAAAPVFSPVVQRELIKGVPKTKGLIKRVAPRALIRSAPTEQQTQEEN